jgi:hypothetical protein
MILLHYWSGPTCPQWRLDCEKQLYRLYPDARIIEYNSTEPCNKQHSNAWRMQKCIEQPYTLWVDNDIWLDKPLPLTDKPGMAAEYSSAHWSIVWSGARPEVFIGLKACQAGKKILELYKKGEADLYIIPGTHWASTHTGERVPRFK